MLRKLNNRTKISDDERINSNKYKYFNNYYLNEYVVDNDIDVYTDYVDKRLQDECTVTLLRPSSSSNDINNKCEDAVKSKKYDILYAIQCNYNNKLLYRIKALKDFGDIKKGDLGGWIESEKNLSQEGNCWVYDEAKVYGNARICDNAKVCDYAKVYDNAVVYGNAKVYNNARVSGDAIICGNAEIYNLAEIYGNGSVEVYGDAKVYGSAQIYDNARIREHAKVYDKAKVYGDAKVYGNARVHDKAKVYGNAWVYGNAEIYNDVEVCNDAEVFVYDKY